MYHTVGFNGIFPLAVDRDDRPDSRRAWLSKEHRGFRVAKSEDWRVSHAAHSIRTQAVLLRSLALLSRCFETSIRIGILRKQTAVGRRVAVAHIGRR